MTENSLEQGYYTKTGAVIQRRESVKGGCSVLLFLRDFGLRWAYALSSSKKNGEAEPLIWGEFTLYQSPNRLYVRGADIKEDFIDLRKNPSKLMAALKISRVISRELLPCSENNEQLKIFWSALIQLREGVTPEAVEVRFIWRLLHSFGAAPSLDVCPVCGKKFSGDVFLGLDGITCCLRSGITISENEIREIRKCVLMPHESFIKFRADNDKSKFYSLISKKLSTYFTKLR